MAYEIKCSQLMSYATQSEKIVVITVIGNCAPQTIDFTEEAYVAVATQMLSLGARTVEINTGDGPKRYTLSIKEAK